MNTVWDTSVASRLQPGDAVTEYALAQRAAGTPVRVAAPAVLEIAYGYQLRAGERRYAALLSWFTDLIDARALTVLSMDARGALVAGRLRATLPHPPRRRRRDDRSKPMRQAAWLLDIQVAATAFASGLEVVTENRADFDLLRDALVDLFPSAPPLEVLDAPV